MIQPPQLAGHEIPTVPFPPATGAMDPTYQLIFTWVLWGICAVVVLFALNHSRRTGTAIALLCLAGGALCVLWEPIVDVMGLCWFWRAGNHPLFELFGRPIPNWMLPVYTAYVGGQTFYTVTRLDKGETVRGVFKLYLIYMVVNLLLEEPPLHFGLYTYYGVQPLQPGLLPLWWTAVNGAMPIIAAALVYRLKPLLTGWKQLLIVLLVPMGDGLANAAAGWPTWIALNSSDQYWVTTVAALCTFALSALAIWIVALSVGTDSPLRRSVVAGGRD